MYSPELIFDSYLCFHNNFLSSTIVFYVLIETNLLGDEKSRMRKGKGERKERQAFELSNKTVPYRFRLAEFNLLKK